ncbi:hypothetical protein [Wolbachia endosymbiont of Cantharis cryptica]|uniref:hypothetical protein n=1 Tax=Wolbachia endosymbiont of Cantharis cryptica TaxID=3066132 RepID=UPI00376ED2EE
MNKEYDETMVKPPTSISKELEETNGSKAQNVFSERKSEINFDDKKYATKILITDQQPLKKEQEPSKLIDFLKPIPIIGRFLVRILKYQSF